MASWEDQWIMSIESLGGCWSACFGVKPENEKTRGSDELTSIWWIVLEPVRSS